MAGTGAFPPGLGAYATTNRCAVMVLVNRAASCAKAALACWRSSLRMSVPGAPFPCPVDIHGSMLRRGRLKSSVRKLALDANFMQIDEVRYAEDMEPLGLDWIRLGLHDVLYNPKTGELFTPNTGTRQRVGRVPDTSGSGEPLQEDAETAILEERGRYYKRDEKGRFAGGGGGSIRRKRGGPKYSPSKQRSHKGIQLKPKEYARICGIFNTRYPGLTPEDGARTVFSATHTYKATIDGYGGLIVSAKYEIKEKG